MPFNEKQKTKLLKTLGKWGVTTEEAAAFLKEADSDDDDPEAEAPKAEPAAQEPVIDEVTPEPSPATPAEAEPEPQPEPAPTPPQEPQPQPTDTPVVQEPDANNARFDELEKAVEGMSTRLDSLIDAMTKAGILAQAPAQQEVGLANDDMGAYPEDESLGDTLAALNRGKRY